jgi:hypothetical protein
MKIVDPAADTPACRDNFDEFFFCLINMHSIVLFNYLECQTTV